MAYGRYKRQKGGIHVFDTRGGYPTYVDEATANANNIWGDIEEVDYNPTGSRYNPDGTVRTSQVDSSAVVGEGGDKPKPVIRYQQSDSQKKESDYYSGLDTTPMTDKEKGAERERIRREMQNQIDSVNVLYDSMVRQSREEGLGRMGQTRAMSARGGLMGSPMGAAQLDKMAGYNAKLVDQINAKRGVKISAIFGRMDERADKAIADKEAGIKTNIKDMFEYNEKVKTDSREDMLELAKSGLDLEDMEREDYKTLLDQTQYNSLVFDSIYNKQLPKNQQKEYNYTNLGDGNILVSYVDPATGQLVQKTEIYDLQQGEEVLNAPDGSLLRYNPTTGVAKPIVGGEAKQDDSRRYMNTSEGVFDTQTGKITVRKTKTYTPGAGKKKWIDLGGKAGTGMTYNEWDKERGGGEEAAGFDFDRDKTSMVEFLKTKAGKDGKVAPDDWFKAGEMWEGTGVQFQAEFKNFRNEADDKIGGYYNFGKEVDEY